MRVLLLEDNLMWSVRVMNGLKTLGHEVVISIDDAPIDLAIVDLATTVGDPMETVRQLRAKGVRVLGHVGHKDKELWRQGEEAGCDKVVSNGSLANRLQAVLTDLGE